MRRAQQGELWADLLVVFAVLIVVGLLLLGSRLRVHGPERKVWQKAQINALNAAVELFAKEFDSYPPSDANDPAGQAYCGAMKLTEAVMGQDLLGVHTKSIFRRDRRDAEGTLLYPMNIDDLPSALRESRLKDRKGPFLQAENANACRLADIYGRGNTGSLPEDAFILCDVHAQRRPSGQKTGMPILYYRANPAGTTDSIGHPDDPPDIYHYTDNQALLLLGVPGKPGEKHSLADPKRFYLNTEDRKTSSKPAPCRPDTFILISAGPDGLYGTADDICNFDWEYRRR